MLPPFVVLAIAASTFVSHPQTLQNYYYGKQQINASNVHNFKTGKTMQQIFALNVGGIMMLF
jgi:hypothetical protein